jgi:hypothetical protein
MSEETKAAKPAKNEGAAEQPTPEAVRVKVLKGGMSIAGSTAARGTIVNVLAADAELFAKRGDVEILGVA